MTHAPVAAESVHKWRKYNVYNRLQTALYVIVINVLMKSDNLTVDNR